MRKEYFKHFTKLKPKTLLKISLNEYNKAYNSFVIIQQQRVHTAIVYYAYSYQPSTYL